MPRPEFLLQVLIALFAGWLNREQQKVIDYPSAENQVLSALRGKRPLRLNDDQRRGLSVKGVALGRALLATPATIVTSESVASGGRAERVPFER
jgi:hypothetical protein